MQNLRLKLHQLLQTVPAYASATGEPSHATANVASASNYDILKRISRFGKRGLWKTNRRIKLVLCNFSDNRMVASLP